MPSAAENVKEIGTLIDLGVKCLEGTTERSDGNRVRSARKGEARTTCLEGTTPQDVPQLSALIEFVKIRATEQVAINTQDKEIRVYS